MFLNIEPVSSSPYSLLYLFSILNTYYSYRLKYKAPLCLCVVCKVSKQVMLLESEKQALEKELEVECKEHRALKTEFQRVRLALEHSLSLVEHNAVTDKFKRYQNHAFHVNEISLDGKSFE